MSNMCDMAILLLQAPDGQIDPSVFPLIEKWDEEPKSIQILEVLDQIVKYGLATDFVVTALDYFWKDTMKKENITMEECVALATWREE